MVLGGTRQANLDRTHYAVKYAREDIASFKNFIAAVSSRELNEADRKKPRTTHKVPKQSSIFSWASHKPFPKRILV